jgi:hypothetical protein
MMVKSEEIFHLRLVRNCLELVAFVSQPLDIRRFVMRLKNVGEKAHPDK